MRSSKPHKLGTFYYFGSTETSAYEDSANQNQRE